jgi:hypothetical protein
MKVLVRQRDLSDEHLQFATQIGADGIDAIAPAPDARPPSPQSGLPRQLRKTHRGGYTFIAFGTGRMRASLAEEPLAAFSVDDHYNRRVRMYERLVPVAEEHDVRLILHPSDPPLPEAELSPQRWIDALDAVPSDHSGMLYCIGTRYEALGDGVIDDIRHWGRRGKILHTHFRNVQGTVPGGGYAEVAGSVAPGKGPPATGIPTAGRLEPIGRSPLARSPATAGSRRRRPIRMSAGPGRRRGRSGRTGIDR